jgi:HEPN domain-containing protein
LGCESEPYQITALFLKLSGVFMSKSRINTAFDEAIFWMNQSSAFFESSKILSDSPSEYVPMPIITLRSFSVECSLKALLLLTCGKYPVKHDSLDLFDLLPLEIQTNLSVTFFSKFEFEIRNAFEAIRGDFIGSRYHFEDLKKSSVGRAFSTGYLEVVSEFLINYIRNEGDAISNIYSRVTGNPNVTFYTQLEP